MKLSRRTVLKLGAFGLASTTLEAMGYAWVPKRMAEATIHSSLPDVQFDIEDYIAPVEMIEGLPFRFGPVFTFFLTASLTRTPDLDDQHRFAGALETIEDHYEFSPSGVFTFISYGLPYFKRLSPEMVAEYMPRLRSDKKRFALEEAVPSPTDVSPGNPGIGKHTFNVPVAIEENDLLITLRSDSIDHLLEVVDWLTGRHWLNGSIMPAPDFANLLRFTSARLMFAQRGMPRKVAESHGLPFATRIPPASPMWLGFSDQHVTASGPASVVTFQGDRGAPFTETKAGDYFYNGAIQHLSHVILDLAQWYDEPFTERVQYMFRSNPIPSAGNADQFTDGGGPAILDAPFQGREDAIHNALGVHTFDGERRMGHLSALQRSSRTAGGTPIHIRMDGPGFDSMDVPDGSNQPKLQFTVFVPTAEFFATMRRNQAALDLVHKHGVEEEDNGIERFLTAHSPAELSRAASQPPRLPASRTDLIFEGVAWVGEL